MLQHILGLIGSLLFIAGMLVWAMRSDRNNTP